MPLSLTRDEFLSRLTERNVEIETAIIAEGDPDAFRVSTSVVDGDIIVKIQKKDAFTEQTARIIHDMLDIVYRD